MILVSQRLLPNSFPQYILLYTDQKPEVSGESAVKKRKLNSDEKTGTYYYQPACRMFMEHYHEDSLLNTKIGLKSKHNTVITLQLDERAIQSVHSTGGYITELLLRTMLTHAVQMHQHLCNMYESHPLRDMMLQCRFEIILCNGMFIFPWTTTIIFQFTR